MPRTGVTRSGSKAEFVRNYLTEQPDATDEDIFEAGKKAKMDITKYSIAYVRYSRPNLNEPPLTAAGKSSTARRDVENDNDLFTAVLKGKEWKELMKLFETTRKFCEDHGGIEMIKQVINSMEKYEEIAKLINS